MSFFFKSGDRRTKDRLSTANYRVMNRRVIRSTASSSTTLPAAVYKSLQQRYFTHFLAKKPDHPFHVDVID